MSPQQITGRGQAERLGDALQDLFARYEEYIRNPDSSPALASDLSKFACVRICGYLEQGIATLALAHVETRSAPTAVRFASSWLSRMQNPRRGALIEFIGRFNHQWGEDFRKWLESVDPANTLDNLVQTRNDIAHGLSTGIGHDALVQYLGLAIDVTDWFADRLD